MMTDLKKWNDGKASFSRLPQTTVAHLALCGFLCVESHAGRVTHHHLDGNRVTQGVPTDMNSTAPLDIPLNGSPVWLVSETFENGVLWVAVLEDGTVRANKLSNGLFSERKIHPAKLPPGMPPLLIGSGNTLRCWEPPADASDKTHGIAFGDGESVAYIDVDGNLVVPGLSGAKRLPVAALPDARILRDNRQRLLMLTDPTTRYLHGVLGDTTEAASFTIVDTQGDPTVVAKVSVGDTAVIEGTSLIWVDVNGDGHREIVATVSASGLGARLRIYRESGEILAEGPSIGRSFRWRNQAAFFQDPHSGKTFLTDVLTPHIGGTLEFFEWDGAKLTLAGSHFGVTSHRIGSRNLDWAIVGPIGLRERFVMVQPNDARTHLVAVGMEDEAAVHHWNLPLSGEIRSNLSSANTPSGGVALGVGTSGNRLRIWQPEERRPYLKAVHHREEDVMINLELLGHPDGTYQIQSSEDLQEWKAIGEVTMEGGVSVDLPVLVPDSYSQPSTFVRAKEVLQPVFADVVDVEWSGDEGNYRFQVTVRSPDSGCDQYADWWEILSDSGELLHRRVLLHSHVTEQPFRRSGGPVSSNPVQPILIRAHMNQGGYGGHAYYGSVAAGFTRCLLPAGFGEHLAISPPLPEGCAF